MGDLDDLSEKTIGFEARKVSVNQNKDGFIVRLSIHPDDVPMSLIRDWVGTNYMVAMTKIDDDGSPVASDTLLRANRAIKSAGMMARHPTFHKFLREHREMRSLYTFDNDHPEDSAVGIVRDYCGVSSRTEFRTDDQALDAFEDLKRKFEEWQGL